ncbi:MAG: polysaccharide biosynthesis protein [Clostridia bacterium]|nr:polysaccharide biosynthesis protein [Clostridia bacterium]
MIGDDLKIENSTIKKNKFSKQKDGLLKGASILAIGGLITKILGAFYRIPLTSLLGTEGLGVYQTAFPVYCLLLTFSSTGVPSAIAKLVSSGYGENGVLKKSLSLFIPIGLLGSLIMCLFSFKISAMQGNERATLSYVFLSPSVFLVSVISCLRGYFQGKLNMLPTAISQITEQAVKLTVGLLLCFYIKGSPSVKGALACLAVTVSEIVTLIYLSLRFRLDGNPRGNTFVLSYKRLIGTLLPISLSTLIIPLARVFDSFTIVNIIGDYTQNATALYGIYTGSVESVVSVPVAVCYGVAVSALPQISSSLKKGNILSVKDKLLKAFSLTIFLASVSGLFLFSFSQTVTKMLFGGLSESERKITASLLSLAFFTVVGLSLNQTLSSCLIALGKPFAPCVFSTAGVLIKFIMQLFLLKNPKINIFGVLYSDITCYFVAVFLNLLYIIYILYKERASDENNFSWNRNSSGRPFA